MIISKHFIAYCDAASPWQFGFQDPATPIISGIINLHNGIMFFLILIAFMVMWLIFRAVYLFGDTRNFKEANKKFTHSTSLEIVWTLTPAFLLLFLAGPSFALLYSIDEVVYPQITVKVIGHQWYWSYEYSGHSHYVTEKNLNFDSYMLSQEDITVGGLRLLEVDSRLKLPTQTHIRVLITSADVLHSWAVPSLGVKIDACPGRLNMVSLYIERPGVFYGQCSEICGVNHGFMPIVVEAVAVPSYMDWVYKMLAQPAYSEFTQGEWAGFIADADNGRNIEWLLDLNDRVNTFDFKAAPGPHILSGYKPFKPKP